MIRLFASKVKYFKIGLKNQKKKNLLNKPVKIVFS